MFRSKLIFLLGAWIIVQVPACREAQFGSTQRKKPVTRDDNGNPINPNDPNNPGNPGNPGDPSDTPIAGESNEPGTPGNPGNPGNPGSPGNPATGTPKPGGGCVDKDGKDIGVVVANFPAPIENCVRNATVSARGLYNFGKSTCEKIKFTKIVCSKENIKKQIEAGGMSSAEYMMYANKSGTVFFEGGCGSFTTAAGEKMVMVQFYQPPAGQYDSKKCVYNYSSKGAFVTGCYINAKDNSWTNLTAAQKVAKCFQVAPR